MDPRIPRGLQAVVLHCLEKDRAARFPSIAALAAALAPFARDARSAGIIVERTAAMLQGPGASVAQAARFGQLPNATTLSGSAGMMRARSTRRYTVGGAAVVLAVIVAVSIVGVMTSRGGKDAAGSAGSGTAAMRPAVASDGPTTSAPTAAAHGASSVPDATEVAVTVNAAVAPTAPEPASPTPKTADPKAKAQQCAELEVNQKWQDLRDCAGELLGLGPKDKSIRDKAEEFRVKAVKEMSAALAATKLKEALAEGNLREAQKQLKNIGQDSAYFPATNDAFRAAEAKAVDDNRRKAQGFLSSHDCAALKRLQAQVNTTSTASVSVAVAAVAAKCVDRVAGPPPGGPDPGHPGPGSNSDTQAGSSGASQAKNLCETMNVEDIMTQAANQYQAGFPKAALQLLTKALACKQEVRMFRMAAFYACAAHDAQAAKLYYGKVPAANQAGIVQRCQQENITIP
jgi:hypothetical protein